MEASITFKSVAKKIKNETLLAELTFGIEKNTVFSMVGPNGSGKSTILKLICGLLYKDKGSIYVKGYDIDTKIDEIKSIIGYMPQKNQMDNELTILENISLYAQLNGFSKVDAIKSSKLISEKLNLNQHLNKFPSDLSFGALRLVSFARAIVHSPEILILDEPTLNLDPLNRDFGAMYNCSSKRHQPKCTEGQIAWEFI
jgi:ABC-2 type transport system ATP-binding protein